MNDYLFVAQYVKDAPPGMATFGFTDFYGQAQAMTREVIELARQRVFDDNKNVKHVTILNVIKLEKENDT